MKNKETAHHEIGFKSILSNPFFYNIFSSIIAKKGNTARFVSDFVKPFPGCKILDIGCGIGRLISDLPNDIGEYSGFDMNKCYIEFARKRWENRNYCKFFCETVSNTTITKEDYYDMVLAVGILHHLTDSEAGNLFKTAYKVLKPGGALITYDNVYIEKQHWFARWLISKDRGKAVRTVDGYRQLATQYFSNMKEEILHDTLRLPYTILQIRCVK